MLGLVAAIREVMDDRALAFRRMQAACAKLELRREYAAEAEAAAAKDGGAASAEASGKRILSDSVPLSLEGMDLARF